MAAPLPPGTLVDHIEGGLRISLPPRPLGAARFAGLFLIPFGLIFAGGPLMGVVTEIRSQGGCFVWFLVAFITPFVAIGTVVFAVGLGLLFPRRATIALERSRLKTTERFGPFWWSWSVPREKITGFQTQRFARQAGQQVMGILAVDVQGRASTFMFGRSYPADWLEAAGSALAEIHGTARLSQTIDTPIQEAPSPPASSPVQPGGSDVALEYTADSVRFTVPPRGIWKANGCLLLFGILWSAMSAVGLAAAVTSSEWGAVAFVFLFVAVGGCLILGAVHSGRKSARLELSGSSLSVRRTGVFGSKVQQWDRRAVARFEVEDSGWKVNDVVQWQLRIELADAKPVKLLRGRPREELDWIASALRSGPLGRVEAAVAAVKVAGSECQVCNSLMTEGVVYCARCKTPHHEQCWRYLGQCSTYGCREIRYTTA